MKVGDRECAAGKGTEKGRLQRLGIGDGTLAGDHVGFPETTFQSVYCGCRCQRGWARTRRHLPHTRPWYVSHTPATLTNPTFSALRVPVYLSFISLSTGYVP